MSKVDLSTGLAFDLSSIPNMSERPLTSRSRRPGSFSWQRFAFAAWLGAGAVWSAAQSPPTELRTAAEVRRLTPDQAETGLPVRLRGVVTFHDGALFSRFVERIRHNSSGSHASVACVVNSHPQLLHSRARPKQSRRSESANSGWLWSVSE